MVEIFSLKVVRDVDGENVMNHNNAIYDLVVEIKLVLLLQANGKKPLVNSREGMQVKVPNY